MAQMVLRREAALLVAATVLLAAGAAYLYLSRATTLTVASAPKGGTEPALLEAYADTLAKRKRDVRLKLVPFDGVRESAQALQAGKVDLAIVRPDVAMPDNGLTLAVLRELAVLVAVPKSSGIDSIAPFAGKRLGYSAERISDKALIAAVLEHDGLHPQETSADAPSTNPGERTVTLVPVAEDGLGQALAEGKIDGAILVTTPSSPAARRLVAALREASPDRALTLIGIKDVDAIVEARPKLQSVTVPAGLYGGNPRVPAEDLATIGASYRLMARSTLSRSVTASVTQHLFEMRAGLAEAQASADTVKAPAYESTAEATSARLPIHPGAIDYYEREQESFVERNEVWIYLVLFFGGGVLTILEWLRLRLSRARRERIEIATEKLLKIRLDARKTGDPARLAAMTREIDDLAASIARFALSKPVEPRTMSAAAIAIEAARSSVSSVGAGDSGIRAVDRA